MGRSVFIEVKFSYRLQVNLRSDIKAIALPAPDLSIAESAPWTDKAQTGWAPQSLPQLQVTMGGEKSSASKDSSVTFPHPDHTPT